MTRLNEAEYQACVERLKRVGIHPRKPRIGGIEPQAPDQLEQREQIALVQWAKKYQAAFPDLLNLFAIPDGGKRAKRVAKMMVAEGVKAGVPDLFLAVPRGPYHGLFIEMKRTDGGRGDPVDLVDLAMKRTDTFSFQKKVWINSTPETKGKSRIEKAFEESSQAHYHLPCPLCGEYQALEWSGKDAEFGIKSERNDQGAVVAFWYECAHCHGRIGEEHKTDMLECGRWVHVHPRNGQGKVITCTARRAGFHGRRSFRNFSKSRAIKHGFKPG